MSILVRAAFGLLAVCALVAICAGGASSSVPAVGGKLVLVGGPLDLIDRAQAGLYVMNADGSDRRQLTHDSSDAAPSWSPDGKRIAFLRGRAFLNEHLMVMRADGTEAHSVGPASAGARWSRDGKQIAWAGCGGLCVYSFTSSRRTRILLGRDDPWGFAWAPNGHELAAVDRNDRLVLVSTANRIVREIAPAGVDPTWSPDGATIAFVSQQEHNALEVAPAAGGRPRVVVAGVEEGESGWAPDGRHLLYVDRRFRLSVVNIATRTTTTLGAGDGFSIWSPDGSSIIYGRQPEPTTGIEQQDVWLIHPDGSGRRQLTAEYPTGLGFEDLDWTAGKVPAVSSPPPKQPIQLTTAGELRFGYLFGKIGRAPTSDSVVYQGDIGCGDPAAEESAGTLNIWTPPTGSTTTTTTSCLDFGVDEYAVTAKLDAWLSGPDLNGDRTVAVTRPGTNQEPPLSSWTSGRDETDIGWRTNIYNLVSDGSTLLFETYVDTNNSSQLWRIIGEATPQAAPIPLPAGAGSQLQAADARILTDTTDGFAVLTTDGAVLSRIPAPAHATAQIGGGLVGIAAASRLRAYTADSGTTAYDLPLAHLSGVPRLLTISTHYAVYESGIELHLLRLSDGNDQLIELPGQAGPLQALLTPAGLFIAYYHGYDNDPARILYVQADNLP